LIPEVGISRASCQVSSLTTALPCSSRARSDAPPTRQGAASVRRRRGACSWLRARPATAAGGEAWFVAAADRPARADREERAPSAVLSVSAPGSVAPGAVEPVDQHRELDERLGVVQRRNEVLEVRTSLRPSSSRAFRSASARLRRRAAPSSSSWTHAQTLP